MSLHAMFLVVAAQENALEVNADKTIIYNKPTRCNSGSIVFINNYKYALHVSDTLLRPSSGAL